MRGRRAIARWVDAFVIVLVLLDLLSVAGNRTSPGNDVAEVLTAAVLLVFAVSFHAWLWQSGRREAAARLPPEGVSGDRTTREEDPD